MEKKKWFQSSVFEVFILSFVLIVADNAFCMQMQDVEDHPDCLYCGMDREKFAHSRMLIEYTDGSSVGTCSLHCTAIEMSLKIDKIIKQILVGDYLTKKLINAEKAFWVVGGDKPGVMTKRAKCAFEKEENAKMFIQEHGGTQALFDDAVKASFEDMYEDIKMIQKKRQMKKELISD